MKMGDRWCMSWTLIVSRPRPVYFTHQPPIFAFHVFII